MDQDIVNALWQNAAAPVRSRSQGRARFVNGRLVLDEPRQPQSGRGGSLTSLISEGGALGGAAAGAAAGSVIPGIGTLVGGLIGGAAGAFGGRLAENKIRDDRWGVGDAAKEATLTAALGAPMRLAKYGVTAAKATRGGKTIADALKAGAQAADAPGTLSTAVRGKIASATKNVRDDAALKNFKINDSNWINRFNKKVGEDPGAFAARLGFATSSPKQVAEKFYNPMQDVYTSYLQQVPSITKRDIGNALSKKIAEYAKSDVADVRATGAKLKAAANELLKRLPDNMTALDARTKKAAFQSAVDEKLTDTAGKLANNVNKQIADAFRKIVNDKADAAGIVIDPTKLPVKGVKATTLRELGNELRGIKEFADKAAIKQNVGRGKNPFGLTPLLAGAAGGGAFGPGGAAGMAAITTAGNSQAGRKLEFSIADKLAKIGRATASGSPTRIGAKTGARGAAAATVAEALGAGQSSPLELNMIDSSQMNAPSAMPQSIPTIMGQPYQDTQPQSSTNPFALENIDANVEAILAQGGDLNDVQKFLSVAQAMQKIQAAPAQKPMSAEASKVVSNAYSGFDSLDQLQSMIQQDPSVLRKTATPGRSIAGGLLGNALGTAGYDNLSRNILDVITRLRTGAALTASEEEFYKQQLPQAFDSPDVIQQKLDMFRDLFSSVASKAGRGGVSVQDALAAYQ